MARLLEELQPGTPVFDRAGSRVGEVRAVYGSGDARSAEFLLVYWDRRAQEALLDAGDVAEVGSNGVHLMSTQAVYEALPAFDPAANPSLHVL